MHFPIYRKRAGRIGACRKPQLPTGGAVSLGILSVRKRFPYIANMTYATISRMKAQIRPKGRVVFMKSFTLTWV